MALHLPSFPQRTEVGDDIVHRLVHRNLTEVLAIVRRTYRSAEPELAARDLVFAEEGADQRGFPGAVRTDEADRLPALECDCEVFDEGSIADTDRDVFCDDHLVATALSTVQPERHGRL